MVYVNAVCAGHVTVWFNKSNRFQILQLHALPLAAHSYALLSNYIMSFKKKKINWYHLCALGKEDVLKYLLAQLCTFPVTKLQV